MCATQKGAAPITMTKDQHCCSPQPFPVLAVMQESTSAESDGVLQLYCTKEGAICDPAFLIKRLAQLPLGAEFCDGGQHDSQEVLRLLLDSLHNDLVCPPTTTLGCTTKVVPKY